MSKKGRDRRQRAQTFLRLSLTSKPRSTQLTAATLLEILDAALTGMYGIVGGAIAYDTISFDNERFGVVIRCSQREAERIQAAATFMTPYKGALCQLQVLEHSPSLITCSTLTESIDDSL